MAKTIRKNAIIALADTLRFLGDPTRCALLLKLGEERAGFYVQELAKMLDVTHSAVSHQLASLEVRGMVEGVREGQMVRYVLAKTPAARKALALLKAAGKE